MAEGIALGLDTAVSAQLFQIQLRDKDPFRLIRLKNTGVPRTFQLGKVGHAVKNAGTAVAVGNGVGIIAGGYRQHIFIGSGPELGEPVDLHRAGVGHQNKLCAFQHQDSCALGKFSVITDHCAHLYLPTGRIQGNDIKIFPRRQVALHIKVTGVYFGIGELLSAETVEEDQRVAGAAFIFFQQRNADGHIQFPGQIAKGMYILAVCGNRLGGPLADGTVVDIVSVTPHLGKKGDISAQRSGFLAGIDPLLEIGLQGGAGGELQ